MKSTFTFQPIKGFYWILNFILNTLEMWIQAICNDVKLWKRSAF